MPAPAKSSMRRLAGHALAALGAALLVCALATTASGAGSVERSQARILSASWGTDNAVGCPAGEKGLDNIPVTFDWFVRRSSIQVTDFRVVRSDGSIATPACALQFPPDERDEGQTVNLIGDFGGSASGPTPVAIRVVGALRGRTPGAVRWRRIPPLPKAEVEPLSGGPYIVDEDCRTASSSRSPRSTSPISTITRTRPTPTTCTISACRGPLVAPGSRV